MILEHPPGTQSWPSKSDVSKVGERDAQEGVAKGRAN